MSQSLPSADFETLFGVNAGYVEKVYHDYLAAPDSVGSEWRAFFEGRFPGASAPAAPKSPRPVAATPATGTEELRGVAAKIALNMAASLAVPTATSTRVVPVKVLEENRALVNQHLANEHRGKASFTHLVAWAMVEALRRHPALSVSYVEVDGKPHRRAAASINLGLAIDLAREGAPRALVVPNLKGCEAMDFPAFLRAYDATIVRARAGKLTPADFEGTTCTLTNPGTLGTVSSLPRLMVGQSFILATGAIDVPAEYQGASHSTLTELGIAKVMTVTSTYDHRVIQGADSGEFLATLHELLIGEHGFYDRMFADLRLTHAAFSFGRDRRSAPGSTLRGGENMERAARVMQFIRSWRVRGYVLADLDPLRCERRSFKELEMATYGLTIWDLDREFLSGGATPTPIAPLREIFSVLRDTYARHVAVEFMHIADPDQREWLRARIEGNRNAAPLSRETQVLVLDRLVQAEAFERFLHTRFVGHKRFSIEGAETLIPTLGALLDRAAAAGAVHAVLGMAHRGRLNVLAHILGKPLEKIFSEFEGWLDPELSQGSGDVKYHLGARGEFATATGGTIHVELASNPSHLEAVNPVVEGLARARQDQVPDGQGRAAVLPVLVHGDAAFAGQGVVAETLNMSELRGYRTGGTIHVIVNNQIGYTTAPSDARSTPFCTDVAKAIQAPIFHVNGDDPLAAVRMAELAFEYRAKFHRDAVIDIVCYRRHGHNEGDEPSFTQPLLYRAIEAHRTVRQIYGDFLVRAGVLTQQEVDAAEARLQERLKASLDTVRQGEAPAPRESVPAAEAWPEGPRTAVATETLADLQDKLLTWPASFTPHPKVRIVLDRRREMIAGSQPIDFACAETLAFATLLAEGRPVRLSGQDSGRGTFSQRHSVLLDHATGERFVPLNALAHDQARYVVIDSLLSEEAVLGFEYGYSVAREDALVLWEAQFGDFCNGAQIQIDQFLAAGEAKWSQTSGLVLLLPHGYDGQGPEHSSARLERFLQLCAEGNLRVANPSTPAQYFHLLRKQALDPVRKPLVVMTQKSLLRAKAAGSRPEELATGGFASVLAEALVPGRTRRVVLCSGKVYYDLLEERAHGTGGDAVALVRVEQLYPWPAEALANLLRPLAKGTEIVWCQEEPKNMGAFTHVRGAFEGALRYVGRPAAASPATGSLQAHKVQQARLVREALTP